MLSQLLSGAHRKKSLDFLLIKLYNRITMILSTRNRETTPTDERPRLPLLDIYAGTIASTYELTELAAREGRRQLRRLGRRCVRLATLPPRIVLREMHKKKPAITPEPFLLEDMQPGPLTLEQLRSIQVRIPWGDETLTMRSITSEDAGAIEQMYNDPTMFSQKDAYDRFLCPIKNPGTVYVKHTDLAHTAPIEKGRDMIGIFDSSNRLVADAMGSQYDNDKYEIAYSIASPYRRTAAHRDEGRPALIELMSNHLFGLAAANPKINEVTAEIWPSNHASLNAMRLAAARHRDVYDDPSIAFDRDEKTNHVSVQVHHPTESSQESQTDQ